MHIHNAYCMYIHSLNILSSNSKVKPVFPQLASQILPKPASELWCRSRAWKVNLTGEGADDAGGVFDETITQMCEVS